MDPVSLVVTTLGPAAGALLGELFGSGNRAEAEALIQKALSQWDSLQAETVDGTAHDDIQVDPRYKNAQLAALDRLGRVADEGGMNLTDRANLNRVQNETAGRAQGQQEALIENFRARGAGGSGAELAARLSTQQSAANRESQAGLDVAATAQQRALDAMMGGGRLAGQVRGQEHGEQSERAQARDLINRYNATAKNSTNLARVQGQTGLLKTQADMKTGAADRSAQTGYGVGLAASGTAAGLEQERLRKARPTTYDPYAVEDIEPPTLVR